MTTILTFVTKLSIFFPGVLSPLELRGQNPFRVAVMPHQAGQFPQVHAESSRWPGYSKRLANLSHNVPQGNRVGRYAGIGGKDNPLW